MSGQSNVGNSSVYQADDQRTVSDSVIEEQKKENRFHEGKEHSHKAQDSSTYISLAHFHYCILQPAPSHYALSSSKYQY